MRKWWKITLVGLLLTTVLIALVLSGRLPEITRETSRPASLPPPPLEKWKTYTDERLHFTFKYPPDWYVNVLTADAGGGGVQISTYDFYYFKTPPPDWFMIEIYVPGDWPLAPGQSLEEWASVQRSYSPSPCNLIRQEHVTVANLDALEETVECTPRRESTAIYIPYNDTTYGNTVLGISASSFRLPIMSEVFRQIVSTFQFVN